MPKKRLGDVLRERRSITADDLDRAIQEQSGKAVMLGELLLQQGKVSRGDLITALEEVTRVPYVDCRLAPVSPEPLKLIPRAVAVRYCVLPISIQGKLLVTVMAEPQNLAALDELRFSSGLTISPRLGFRNEILATIDKYYPAPTPEKTGAPGSGLIDDFELGSMEFISSSPSERNQAAIREFQAEMRGDRTPAVRLVSSILLTAATRKASDIHIEQHTDDAVVRIRVDGILRELTRIPGERRMQVVSRIKILSDMDIAERRMPQDGRFLARIANRQIDLRVSTLPTQYGEKVVMRLLDPAAAGIPFQELGFSRENAEAIAGVLSQPQGMVLVTGPTGSGKSTTLYSALNLLRSPRVNIVTIEDPVEYVIEGVNQVHVSPKAGRTFAACLRSMLRQDPNVIMVGEIRDGETAEIALTAAQTGHLVLSTLHTNDSISAVTRLIDLNVPSFLISSSLTAVVAQRLVRKLCKCRLESSMTEDYAARLTAAGLEHPGSKMWVPVGCDECENTGYKGRIGVYEVLVMDEQMRVSIRTGCRDDELRDLARAGGFRVMQEDALDKVNRGLTALDEVMRVVPLDNPRSALCTQCNHALSAKFLFCPYCGHKVFTSQALAAIVQGNIPREVQ